MSSEDDENDNFDAQNSLLSSSEGNSEACSSSIRFLNDKKVKVYRLNTDGGWLDLGTGYANCHIRDEIPYLIVMTEALPSTLLLESKIRIEDVYERQGESIIMWRDRDPIKGESEYALSFQHAGKF